MIAVLKQGTTKEQAAGLIAWLERQGVGIHLSEGKQVTIIGLIGDTSRVDIDLLNSLEIVDSVKRVSEPFKQANRKFHPADTVVTVGNVKIGGGHFATIAGPCSVESEEQIIAVAESVKASGAQILRGGAFKPRTSPYAFQGLKGEGIELLLKAKQATGLPIITEIMTIRTGSFPGRGHHPGWCPEYAEFRFAEGIGQDPQAYFAQTGPCKYIAGAFNERRIYHERGK